MPDIVRARRFLLGTLLVLTSVSLFILAPFLSGTIFAVLAGYLLQRPFRALKGVVRWAPLAAGLLVTGVLVVVCVPIVLTIWQLVDEAATVVRLAREGGFLAWMVDTLANLGVPPETAAGLVTEGVVDVGELLQRGAITTLGKVPRVLGNIGVFVFLLFFALLGGKELGERLRGAIPLPHARRDHLMRTVGLRIRALFLGTFLVAVIQGGVATLGWWLLGFPNPLFWGFVMTVLAVIPAIGPILVMGPAGVLAILGDRFLPGLVLILYGVAIVGLVDNFARPFIVGRTARIHPSLILLGTLGGLVVFGATGFILGPLILSMLAPVLDELQTLNNPPA